MLRLKYFYMSWCANTSDTDTSDTDGSDPDSSDTDTDTSVKSHKWQQFAFELQLSFLGNKKGFKK